jgi:hypothetical protein
MATRFYLSTGSVPDITPAFEAWNETDGALRRMMSPTAYQDALADGSALASTAGNKQLHRQYISDPMDSGIAFTTATTFSCQIMGLESAINDNIINRVRAVKIVDVNGTVVRATLVALGNAASVVEWNTAMRNLTFLSANTSAVNYTTVAGDRLVLEVGHLDSGGTTVSGTLRFGITGQTADLGANETDTTTTLRPWFETSVNITSQPAASTGTLMLLMG